MQTIINCELLSGINSYLLKFGISDYASLVILFLSSVIILFFFIWLLNLLLVSLSYRFRLHNKSSFSIFINELVGSHFFSLLLLLIAFTVFAKFSKYLINLFESWYAYKSIIIQVVFTTLITLLIRSFLNAWQQYALLNPKTKKVNYKSFIQAIDLSLLTLVTVYLAAVVSGKSISGILLLFGGSVAFITLVFGDIIPVLLASIKLSLQDMLRPEDWIEIPSKGTDGRVIDINLNTVRVENWDKSINLIPIELLVQNSFNNWRRMEEGNSRLFRRTFFIDLDSVKMVDKVFIERISTYPVIGNLINRSILLASISSNNISNLALFRAYLELFIQDQQDINKTQWLFIRYLQNIGEIGLGVEVFAFSRKTAIIAYDEVHRMVMEHILFIVPIFDLHFFQNAAGKDFRPTSTA